MLLCSGTTKVRGTNREDLNDSLEHPPSTKYTVCTVSYPTALDRWTDHVFEVILAQGQQGSLVSADL